MIKQNYKTIDEYILTFSTDIQEKLNLIRITIKESAPNATEKISYGMPTFYLSGNLVHFAAFKNHIGFFSAPTGIKAFENEVSKYKTGKGTLQFKYTEEIPLGLISKITKFRVNENLAKK